MTRSTIPVIAANSETVLLFESIWTDMSEKGILYFAKGSDFFAEAKISAKQAKNIMDIPITIITDQNTNSKYFDKVIKDNSNFSKSDKPNALLKSPYEKTLFIDTDIWIEEDILEVFDLLNKFDLGLVKDPIEPNVHQSEKSHPIKMVPEAFPEFNTGFMIYNNTQSVKNLFKSWKDNCKDTHQRDQRSFRPTLYRSEVRFTPIPPRYNCLYRAENSLNGKVKVFHGQLADVRESNSNFYQIPLKKAIRKINKQHSSRVSYRYKNTVVVNPPLAALSHLQYTLQEEGFLPVFKGFFKYISKKLN